MTKKMLRYHIRILISKFRHYSFSFLINLFGLTLGLGGVILIFLHTHSELNYDNFYDNSDRIYRLVRVDTVAGNPIRNTRLNSILSPEVFTEGISNIESVGRLEPIEKAIISYKEINNYEDNFYWADNSILNIFNFDLLEGTYSLENPNTLIITKRLAEKYFKNEDPIGKIITLNHEYDLEVVGIVRDLPYNTHFDFEFLASYSTIGNIKDPWSHQSYYYVLVLEKNFKDAVEKSISSITSTLSWWVGNKKLKYELQSLEKIYLHSYEYNGIRKSGNIHHINIIVSIGVLIILIVSLNYINITTAYSSIRFKEISLKKVLGASKYQLTIQLILESILLCIFSLVLALVLIKISLQIINNTLNINIRENWEYDTIVMFFSGTVLLGILAGIYPALSIAKYNPIELIRMKNLSFQSPNFNLRKILVIIQLFISSFLIFCSLIVYNQINYIVNKDLGYNKEQTLAIFSPNLKEINIDNLKHSFSVNTDIISITTSSGLPFEGGFATTEMINDEEIALSFFFVDKDFISTLDIQILEGQDFIDVDPSTRRNSYIINESMARVLGLENPIGEQIETLGEKGEIIGIVKDFHNSNLNEPISPLIIKNSNDYNNNLIAKIKTENLSAVMGFIQKKWKEILPNQPLEYSFIDEKFDFLYRKEIKLSRMLNGFTSLTILVACLGLLGLSKYLVEVRVKEIGVRKVVGASAFDILILLIKEFALLIIIAFLFSIPVSYRISSIWLSNFVYHVEISVMHFLISGLIIFLIAFTTISYHSLQAALVNPLRLIRSE